MKNWNDLKNNWLVAGAAFLFLAVGLGAFGAHGLEKTLSEKAITTFKTGVTYQFYHGFALLLVGVLQAFSKISHFESSPYLKRSGLCFAGGVLLFSFNCYLYALTTVKTFAMIVPLGGLSFLLGWLFLIFAFIKRKA